MTRLHRSTLTVLSFASAIAGCSGGGGGGGTGGGGGGSVPPTNRPATPSPTPSPAPTYVLPSANAATLSTYSVDSYPQGLTVTLDGSTAGTSPISGMPAYSKSAHTVTVVPRATGSASPVPYVVTFAQSANGPHAIFYNQTIDTRGKLTAIATAAPHAVARGAAAWTGPRRLALSAANRPRFDARRLIVHFDPSKMANASIAQIEARNGALHAETFASSARDITRIVTLPAGANADDALRAFAADARVRSADRVRLRYPLASSSGPKYPSDTFFVAGEQWNLDTIDAVDAWGYSTGGSAPIAVIDTGYDPNQPEVATNVTKSEKIVGGTLDTGAGAATDTDGHGTYVSGIAAAQTNNAAGFAGIAWGTPLQEYKVFPDGSSPAADSSDVAEAIRLAVANGAKVIVCALGGTSDAGPDPLERDAVAFAIASGAIVVAGSGDEGNTTLDYPAAYDGVIAVGASAVNDASSPGSAFAAGNFEYVPGYSNSAPALALVAPGGDPSSSTDTDLVHWIAGAYTTQPYAGDPSCASGTAANACGILDYGTTPAAAQVAGTVQLLLSVNGSLTGTQVASILENSADDIGDARQGHGRLNAHRALAIAAGDTSPMPAPGLPTASQFVAFAYDNSGGTTPHMLGITYPNGSPVAADGSFRVADIAVAAEGTYRIALWSDRNANGVVDAGDYFVASAAKCSATAACAGTSAMTAGLVPAGYVLP